MSSCSSSITQDTGVDTTDRNLDIIQDMIDLSANHLEGLRTQCATSSMLTQQEIRCLESKLVRFFSELLITKIRLNERIPANGLLPHHDATGNELRQWLRVVGLCQETLNIILSKVKSLEETLKMSDEELKEILDEHSENQQREEEIRRLTRAMQNLRKCMETLEDGSAASAAGIGDPEQWHWDSWDRLQTHHRGSIGPVSGLGLVTASPRLHHRNKGAKSGGGGSTSTSTTSTIQAAPEELSSSSRQGSQLTLILTPSPPNSPFTPSLSGITGGGGGSLNGTPQRSRKTPPPAKKHQTTLLETGTAGFADDLLPRTRLHTDPSPDSHSSASSTDICADATSSSSSSNVLQVPCSSPGVGVGAGVGHVGMGHAIKHRFSKGFGLLGHCTLCQKQLFPPYLKCTDCKYICHFRCGPHVPPSCGLPKGYVDEFRQRKEQVGYSATLPHVHSKGSPMVNKQQQQICGDSSSPSSSCTSSTPSSPALFQQRERDQERQRERERDQSGSTPLTHNQTKSQFYFPNVTITSSNQVETLLTNSEDLTSESSISTAGTNFPPSISCTTSYSNGNNNPQQQSNNHNNNNSTNGHQHLLHNSQTLINSQASNASTTSSSSTITSFFPRKLSTAGVDKRLPFTSEYTDTHKSNDSDKTTTVSLSGSASTSTDSDRTPVRVDSTEDGDSGQWRQNSISLKEWDIPYGDLRVLEQIGQGRFGTVHRALWHGDVAVKLLNEDYLQDEQMLETFRMEVANFKKTRHENLVLFMGACMNPPNLAIVTSLCKGNTLYTYIHQRKEKFPMNRILLIAQQIAQGMGYLHARDIIHKDLRTKNIFIENGKVIITDFGLFSSTKLLYCDMGLGVPHNWLCYLAPELIRALPARKPTAGECLEFTPYSDVYSFGTVWYELICGEFTFKDQPPESIIWQVGRGMKQSLANLQSGRDVKDLLMLCWTYEKEHRPEFARLLSLLELLPKKRLARSPSHPVNLSRSAESVF
ncbi:kinase suppressor of Ras 2 [Drosophila tropicalis]|uniref:kinase suppressor of Ras 2 n=1 Tax=Drosophila tropicalis TaxID=46794 RepID=UPI0035ABC8DF